MGPIVIKQLLDLDYSVTLITRDATKTRQRFNSYVTATDKVKVEEADFSSAESIAPLLRKHQSVVILINRNELEAQIKVIDAAIEARVDQIIPSSFGLDTSIPEVRANPAVAEKVQMEDHLFSKIPSPGIDTSYTVIQTGLFLDWALCSIGVPVNIVGKGDQPTMLFDGGDVKLSMSHLDDIGKAVATAVEHRKDERFKNKTLFMHTIAGTQNDFIACAKALEPGKPWPMVKIDTAEAARRSQEALEKGDSSTTAMRGFIVRNTFGEGLGLFQRVDNDILGIKEQDSAYIKELLRHFL